MKLSKQERPDNGLWWIKYVVQIVVALIGAAALVIAAYIGLAPS